MARPLLYRPNVGPRDIRSAQRGFTLVELMTVVIIVAVLAMLAIVGYRKVVDSSHTSEATHMVNSIRVAQEEYHAEVQQYLNVSNDLNSTYPSATPGMFKTAWGADCTTCTYAKAWADLPVHVDGPVMFGYATIAGLAGGTTKPPSITVNGTSVATPQSPITDWYMIAAHGKPNGKDQIDVYGTSFTNDIWINND